MNEKAVRKAVNLTLKEDEREFINEFVKKNGVSLAALVRNLILKYIKQNNQ